MALNAGETHCSAKTSVGRWYCGGERGFQRPGWSPDGRHGPQGLASWPDILLHHHGSLCQFCLAMRMQLLLTYLQFVFFFPSITQALGYNTTITLLRKYFI